MKLLELDSYNMENDRTFLKSIEEHVKDPYIREKSIPIEAFNVLFSILLLSFS